MAEQQIVKDSSDKMNISNFIHIFSAVCEHILEERAMARGENEENVANKF